MDHFSLLNCNRDIIFRVSLHNSHMNDSILCYEINEPDVCKKKKLNLNLLHK